MNKVTVAKEQAKYIKEVLGVDRLYLSTPLEEERADEKSWTVHKRFSDAQWLVLVDLSQEELLSEEEELLSKMLAATKIPEQHINVYLLGPGAEVSAKLRKEAFKYKKILCLGEKSHQALCSATKDFEAHKLQNFFKQNFASSYSLSQLQNQASNKATTWNLMKALIQV